MALIISSIIKVRVLLLRVPSSLNQIIIVFYWLTDMDFFYLTLTTPKQRFVLQSKPLHGLLATFFSLVTYKIIVHLTMNNTCFNEIQNIDPKKNIARKLI